MSDSSSSVLVPTGTNTGGARSSDGGAGEILSDLERFQHIVETILSTNSDVFDAIASWSAEHLPRLSEEIEEDCSMLMHLASQLWQVDESDHEIMGDAARVAFQIAKVYYEAVRQPRDMLGILLLVAATLNLDSRSLSAYDKS